MVAGLLSHLWMRIIVLYLIAAIAASVAGSRPQDMVSRAAIGVGYPAGGMINS